MCKEYRGVEGGVVSSFCIRSALGKYPEDSSIFKVSDNAFLSTSMGRLNIPCPSPLPQQHKKVRNIRVIILQSFFYTLPPPCLTSTKRWEIFELFFFFTFVRFQEHKSSKYWCWRWSLSQSLWLRWIIWLIRRADKADMGFCIWELSQKRHNFSNNWRLSQ